MTCPTKGQFQQGLPVSVRVLGATKWCVFRPTEPSRAVVRAAVQERLSRMQTRSVDLLQVMIYNVHCIQLLTPLRV